MSFTDLLTIAMPCYERKDFFREALESALKQTVKCKIIVLDNCSSHNYYEEVCKEKGVTYIYDMILKVNVSDTKLKKKASKNAF